jgi:hypothetical protein
MRFIPYLGNAIQMLQAEDDVDNLLENTAETPTMTFSLELEFKRLNACRTRASHLFFTEI